MNSKTNKGFIPIIIILLVLLGIGGVYYFGTLKPKQIIDTATPNVVTSNQPSPVATPSVNLQTSESTYVVPSSWTSMVMFENLKVCLPPKWEADQWGNIYYNRDTGYRPNVTYIQNIPYNGGSTLQAYYDFWKSEYPNVSELVSSKDKNINGNRAKLIIPKSEQKSSPEGLTLIWYTSEKLWKANLSNWNMVNSSQTAFLKDFYTLISCSF